MWFQKSSWRRAWLPVSSGLPLSFRAVAGCCNPRGCDKLFTPRFARRMAKRYRKRGLDRTARRMVEEQEDGTVFRVWTHARGVVTDLDTELARRISAIIDREQGDESPS